jgi:hypothetical protein
MITRVIGFFGVRIRGRRVRWDGRWRESEEKEEAKCLYSSILLLEDRGNKDWI